MLLLGAAGAAPAQSGSVWLAGAGISLPASEFGSYANPGWNAIAGWEHRIGHSPVALRLDASYGANSDSTDIGFHETTTLLTTMVDVVYHFDGARPRLYALAGGGYFRHHFSSDDPAETAESVSQLAFQFGEGLCFRLGRSSQLYLEARLVTSFGPDRLQFFPLMAGVRFGGSTR